MTGISVHVQHAECILEIEHGMPARESQYAALIPTWLLHVDFAKQFTHATTVGQGKTFSAAAMKQTIESYFDIPSSKRIFSTFSPHLSV